MKYTRRIAFISEHASPLVGIGGADAGGQNVYVDELSRQLGADGYLVDIFTRRDCPDQPEIVNLAPGVRVIHLTAGPVRFYAKDDLWPLMPAFRDSLLQFLLREELHYDLVHGHFWMSGWVATELQRLCHIPCVQLFHALGRTKRRYQQEADSSPRERIEIECAIVRLADQVIAQCPAERLELLEDYHADPDRITFIPGAVNTHTFYPVERGEARQKIGLPQDGKVIVYVGRVLPRKDIRNIIHALALLINNCELHTAASPLTLLVVGGETEDANPQATPEIQVLQELVRQLGLEPYVRFVGKRAQESLRYYYSAGDVAVTTPWYEPFGLTPLEAMACGRPVIGSNVGGITSTILEEQTGFLVPPRDPDRLAERLYTILTRPALAARMGEVARERVISEFTWSVTARRTALLYERVIARQARAIAPFWASHLMQPILFDNTPIGESN